MSREIKFRAWDKVGRGMSYMTDNGVFRRAYYSTHVNCYQDTELGHLIQKHNSDEVILMQFTGLKDKNGKEIYEGDIVKTTSHNFPEIGKVVFKNGGFYNDYDDIIGDEPCDDSFSDCFEVIGNIYEHPSLLNGEEGK